MAKQSVIAGEYILQIEDNGHVTVVRVPKNAKATMVKIAESKGFQYDQKWNTHDLGRALCKEFGDSWTATFDDITITRRKDNKIEIVQECNPVKGALKDICEKMRFEYDPAWNTQYFGKKVANYLLENKKDADNILKTSNIKKNDDAASTVAACNTDDLERFEENGKYGFKDPNGKVVIPCLYDNVFWSWENGFRKVAIDGKAGYINSTGKVIVPVEYDFVSYMKDGNYFIAYNGDWREKKIGVISSEGKVIVPFEYDSYDDRWLKDACIIQKAGTSYILGNGGVIEKELPYDHYERFDDATGLALVRRDGKWGYVNKELEEVVPCENQYYVLCVTCNPYMSESMPMDADTLKNSMELYKQEYEYELEEKGLSKAKKLSKTNIGDVFAALGNRMFYEYRSDSHSYVDEVEEISLTPISGDDWWDEYRSSEHDDDVTFYPEEADIDDSDFPVQEDCITTIYKHASFACGMFYRLIIKDVEEFDPSKLRVSNPGEGSEYWNIPDVFYNESPLKYLGDGFNDLEFEYSTARLFWNGEEIDLPEMNSGYDDDEEDW